jgi:NDP-sugar pyrophosphorylase family protein
LRALILAAGLGTRLRPLTTVRAKAAVPVNGEPLVRRVIAWLVDQRIDDLVVNLHHRPSSITAVVGEGRDLGARVRYSWENPVLGSGGGVRHALPLLLDPHGPSGRPRSESAFLLVNGDTLTDLPIADMAASHQSSGALVTMALIRNPRPDLYGGVLVSRDKVEGFSRRGAVPENFHFIGVQIAEGRAFARLEDAVPAESVAELYPQLIRENPGSIGAFIVDAPFKDVGTPADYLQTSLDLAALEGDRLISSVGTAIDPTAQVSRTAVWDDASVGAHARLDECIICDGVSIPEGAEYRRCAMVLRDGRMVVEKF